jgi:hypothetical protein
MRKRNAARPRLESIEDRLVLNAAAFLDPTAGLRTAIAALVPAHHAHATPAQAAHHTTVHRTRSEVVTHHPHTSKTAHPAHHHSTPPKSSGSNNPFSNFFKNIFGVKL